MGNNQSNHFPHIPGKITWYGIRLSTLNHRRSSPIFFFGERAAVHRLITVRSKTLLFLKIFSDFFIIISKISHYFKNKIIMQGWLYVCEDIYFLFDQYFVRRGLTSSGSCIIIFLHNYLVFSLNIICWSDLGRSGNCSLFSRPLHKKLSTFIKLSSDV